jgi:hypothetical protein
VPLLTATEYDPMTKTEKRVSVPIIMSTEDTLKIYATPDFPINGKGDHANWGKTRWNSLQQIDEGATGYTSHFKTMYSATGIYVLFQGKDRRLQLIVRRLKIFKGDVFKYSFIETDHPCVFWYEINALAENWSC